IDEVLAEIPRVREDLGMLPLVTPTSQIVGTQAVINVLAGARYATITKETAGVLKGEYGETPLPVNAELQAKVLDGAEAVVCRPADLLEPELESQTAELLRIAKEKNICLANAVVDDVLTYALFPQIGAKFLENRNNPAAFEPVPTAADEAAAQPAVAGTTAGGVYSVRVNGKTYTVEVAESGQLAAVAAAPAASPAAQGGKAVKAVLAGNIFKVNVAPGTAVEKNTPLLVVEAMKMETVISAPCAGTVTEVFVKAGDAVAVGDALLVIA
ncbi:MAG: biotin/lipoyl-binding protein, partial [Gammaproteobacteria bacterium]|nr:biotin/lipoyl-binding protein [Gammaproteobacteria bacterium]